MIVHTLHVVMKIVPTWESVAWRSTFTSSVVAHVWPVTMAMHPVSLSFVSEETCCGGELLLGARFDLAPEGLQVRVDELTTSTSGGQLVVQHHIEDSIGRTHSCTSTWWHGADNLDHPS